MADQTRDEWEDPYPDIDETTASVELHKAQERLERAETGEQRTASVIGSLRSVIADATVMHDRNHYVARLRPIFRGTNNAA
jgi:hypothetical protein